MGAVVLAPDVEERLDQVVGLTGRTRADIVTEAVLALLDDLQDVAAAEAVLAEIAAGRSSSTPLEEVERELGLARRI